MLSKLLKPPLALVVVTQVLLAATFVIVAVVLGLFPTVASSIAEAEPQLAHIRLPMLTLAMTFCASAMVGVVAIALLVDRIRRSAILEQRSLRLVDVLVGSFIAAVACVVGAFVVLVSAHAGPPPALAGAMIATSVALAALAGVTLVLRAPLRQSNFMSSELESVV